MTQLELDFGEEFAPQGKTGRAHLVSLALDAGFNPKTSEEIDMLEMFADLITGSFMDRLVAHPSICKQIVDAGVLWSYPEGFKKREPK
mgnify:CR=1 FL=1